MQIITDSLDALCPWKTISVRENQPEWFNGSVKKAMLKKRLIYRNACKTNLDCDWDKVREAKRQVRKLIIQNKRAYITGKLNEYSNIPRKFWHEIHRNLLVGNIKSSATNIQLDTESGRKVEGSQAANEINVYYSKVGAKLAEKFRGDWDENSIDQLVHVPVMNFRFIGEKETKSLIKALPAQKPSQVKNISTKYLIDALIATHFEFSHILNESLASSVMPNSWKIGTITPVPKKPLSKKVSDFRPISCLPTPSKIIERAVYNQIVYHLETYGLLDTRQHGFRRNHSTSTAVFTLVQYIYDKLENRNYVGCIYVDYSKAFDTLDHEILCKKLERFRLDKNVVNWCRDYLYKRKQRVKVNEVISDFADVTYGVPQGSILGPLFFIMYVNDVITSFDENSPNIILYADDTAIYYEHEQLEVLEEKLTLGLIKLSEWCRLNKLTINFDKNF